MRFGSVCSGIEAASVAWRPLGWQCAFVSEIDRFPCAVLTHHYPDVPNYGDLAKFAAWPDSNINVLIGGTPCQSFSIAGLRAGMADPRGNLALAYLACAARYRPRWLVWENVPGVLSSRFGRDFATFLHGLAELGYGFAYRILDAQYFGLAQRRARVFVIASARGWACAAAVLFERESLRGDPAPRREAGQNVAPTLSARTEGGGGLGTDFDLDGGLIAKTVTTREGRRHDESAETLIAFDTTQITSPENRCQPQAGDPCHPLASQAHPPAIAFNARQDPDAWEERAGPLDTDGSTQAIAFSCKDHGADAGEIAPTLRAMNHSGSHANAGGQVAVNARMGVRRITPREAERLMGFPDDFTLIPYRGKPAADGPRYKALGNSMAVPVIRWIGERIQLVEDVHAELGL